MRTLTLSTLKRLSLGALAVGLLAFAAADDAHAMPFAGVHDAVEDGLQADLGLNVRVDFGCRQRRPVYVRRVVQPRPVVRHVVERRPVVRRVVRRVSCRPVVRRVYGPRVYYPSYYRPYYAPRLHLGFGYHHGHGHHGRRHYGRHSYGHRSYGHGHHGHRHSGSRRVIGRRR